MACFDTIAASNPTSLINSISSMDIGNMDPFRKNYIAAKVKRIEKNINNLYYG